MGKYMTEISELRILFRADGLVVEIAAEEDDVIYEEVTDFAARVLDLKKYFGPPGRTKAPTVAPWSPTSPGEDVEPELLSVDKQAKPIEPAEPDDEHGPLAAKDKELRAFLDEDDEQ